MIFFLLDKSRWGLVTLTLKVIVKVIPRSLCNILLKNLKSYITVMVCDRLMIFLLNRYQWDLATLTLKVKVKVIPRSHCQKTPRTTAITLSLKELLIRLCINFFGKKNFFKIIFHIFKLLPCDMPLKVSYRGHYWLSNGIKNRKLNNAFCR